MLILMNTPRRIILAEMTRLFCFRRLAASGQLTPCEHHDAGYGKVLTGLPRCDNCALPLERPTADDEALLAMLEACIGDPIGTNTARVGWDAVELVAGARAVSRLIGHARALRSSDNLQPSFPWTVHAEGQGLIFTRRK